MVCETFQRLRLVTDEEAAPGRKEENKNARGRAGTNSPGWLARRLCLAIEGIVDY